MPLANTNASQRSKSIRQSSGGQRSNSTTVGNTRHNTNGRHVSNAVTGGTVPGGTRNTGRCYDPSPLSKTVSINLRSTLGDGFCIAHQTLHHIPRAAMLGFFEQYNKDLKTVRYTDAPAWYNSHYRGSTAPDHGHSHNHDNHDNHDNHTPQTPIPSQWAALFPNGILPGTTTIRGDGGRIALPPVPYILDNPHTGLAKTPEPKLKLKLKPKTHETEANFQKWIDAITRWTRANQLLQQTWTAIYDVQRDLVPEFEGLFIDKDWNLQLPRNETTLELGRRAVVGYEKWQGAKADAVMYAARLGYVYAWSTSFEEVVGVKGLVRSGGPARGFGMPNSLPPAR